jgi:hypothetical protein
MEDDIEVEGINIKEARADIAAGVKALRELYNHDSACRDWNHWSAAIRGLRGLRSLCWFDAGTTDMKSQNYRDAMGIQLAMKKNAAYAEIPKDTRHFMYLLCDHIEEIDDWYGSLPIDERLRWKHPQSIAKHCPPELLGSDRPGERTKRKAKKKKKRGSSFEEDRLRKLLVYLVEKYVRPVDPKEAADLLEQIWAGDLNDELDDIYTPDSAEKIQ